MATLFEDQVQGLTVVGVETKHGSVKCIEHSPDCYMFRSDAGPQSIMVVLNREELSVLFEGVNSRFLSRNVKDPS